MTLLLVLRRTKTERVPIGEHTSGPRTYRVREKVDTTVERQLGQGRVEGPVSHGMSNVEESRVLAR